MPVNCAPGETMVSDFPGTSILSLQLITFVWFVQEEKRVELRWLEVFV